MCGIVGFVGENEVKSNLLDGLSSLEYRGYDSAGVAFLSEGHIISEKTAGRIVALQAALDESPDTNGNCGIGHTRWATHGSATRQNAHPHISFDGKFAVVHNGIIENYAEIKKELQEGGITFISETDTEVIPHLLSRHYNGNIVETVDLVIQKLRGAFALGILCTECPDTLIAVKQTSPLVVGAADSLGLMASDLAALLPYKPDVYYPDDREIAVITRQGVSFFKEGAQTTKSAEHIDETPESVNKGNFEHYMMKEIFEQPDAVKKTMQKYMKNGRADFKEEKTLEGALVRCEKIFIVACGSAYHAGLVGANIIRELTGLDVSVHIASEFRYSPPRIDDRVITIAISQSGETADTLAAINEAKGRGSYTIGIVNVKRSTLSKQVDCSLYTEAGPEIAVATTKGYTTQVVLLALFGVWASEIKGVSQDRCSAFLYELAVLPECIQKCLSQKDIIRKMAERPIPNNSVFFIGRGPDYAVAKEASLKLKEISYVHSEAYAAGELKHGTISLIEKGTTVIALACHEPLKDKMISNIKEVKARGAYVIGAANETDEEMKQVCDEVIFLPTMSTSSRAAVEIVPFQFYAYYVAQSKGFDIDKPRNLAKSVTVE